MVKGERAYRGTGNFQGEFYDYRMHPECARDMNADPFVFSDGFMAYEGERPIAASADAGTAAHKQ